MNKIIKVLLLLPLFFLHCKAQPVDQRRLDGLFDALAEKNLAMGSVAISLNGTLAYKRAIGYAAMEGGHKKTVDSHTKYRIGSVSKMFTAVMIFQLVEAGSLHMDQTIEKYFPALPNAARITIAHLLSHRSGLHNYTHDTNFPDWMDQPKTQEDLLKIIIEKGADFEPGTRAEYSNTNYLLLGYILERIDGTSYAEALNNRIVSKIGLSDTHAGKSINPAQNESVSYTYFDSTWTKEKETAPNLHNGAGSVVSTPSDLVKFVEALFSYRLISQASVNKMKTFDGDYGMGLFRFAIGNKTGAGHHGKLEGFSASLQYFADDKLAVAYCTNGQVYPKDDILEGILKICFRQPYDIPMFKQTTLPSAELDKYLGTYVGYQMPITLTCTKNNNQLLAETKGKVFVFTPIGKHQFMNAQYGYFFVFDPEKKNLVLKESDKVYYLRKQN